MSSGQLRDYPVRGGSRSTSYHVGFFGEALVITAIEAAKWRVWRSSRLLGEKGDVSAVNPHTGQILAIEVKTSLETLDQKYRFTLWKKGRTDHRQSDIVLCLAVTPTGHCHCYVMPTIACKDITVISITNHPTKYKGRWNAFHVPLSSLTSKLSW